MLSSVFEKMKERMEEKIETITGISAMVILAGRKASVRKHQATQHG